MDKNSKNLIAEASFYCKICSKLAGKVKLIRGETGISLESGGFSGSMTVRIVNKKEVEEYLRALKLHDAKSLYAIDFETVPFYCPACDGFYCSLHYNTMVVWDRDEPIYYDCTIGTCPEGHKRMLQD